MAQTRYRVVLDTIDPAPEVASNCRDLARTLGVEVIAETLEPRALSLVGTRDALSQVITDQWDESVAQYVLAEEAEVVHPPITPEQIALATKISREIDRYATSSEPHAEWWATVRGMLAAYDVVYMDSRANSNVNALADVRRVLAES